LQELLAPKHLRFYNSAWGCFSTKETLQITRDDSILAWGLVSPKELTDKDPGQVVARRALATAPSDLANSGHIAYREQSSTLLSSLEISGGNLRVYLSLLTAYRAIGLLNRGPEDDQQLLIRIPLTKTAPGASNEYVRAVGWRAALQPRPSSGDSPRLIHIRNKSQSKKFEDASRQYWLYHAFAEVNLDLIGVSPRSCWDTKRAMIISTITPSDGAIHRTLTRFRHNEGENPDFVILLESKEQDASIEPRCHVMICSRDFALQKLAEKLQYVLQQAFGKRSASNGLLHLHVALEPDAQPLMITIKPEALSYPPAVTIDTSVELQKSDLTLKL
jgi:hypothetical protein